MVVEFSVPERITEYVPAAAVSVLLAVGFFTTAAFVAKTLLVLLQTFILPGKSVKKYGSKDGSWAVVTGATDGIGKEFALQLAKAGFNILLVSRSEDKLKAVTAEIVEKFNVKAARLPIDFSAAKDGDYEALAHACRGCDIGVLVNNVGKSHEMPVSFLETPVEEQQAIIDININGTLRVTKVVLKNMLHQNRGLILTLSSFAGATPSPLLATYSGSKAFLQTWSDALQSELQDTGIDVECVSTYFVVSNMSRIRRSSALIPTPKAFVSSVLKKIKQPCGALWTGRPSTSTPYWSHSLLDYFINLVGWKTFFISYTLGLHKDIRKRALRKKERESAAARKQE